MQTELFIITLINIGLLTAKALHAHHHRPCVHMHMLVTTQFNYQFL